MKTWYVYMLCDPDTEEPFYVGKGTGNRMDSHELNLDSRGDSNVAKKEVIRRILSQGKQVLKKKVAEFDDERDAYAYEVSLIKLYKPQLTNIKPGGGKLYSNAVSKPKKPKQSNPVRCVRKRLPYTHNTPYVCMEAVAEHLKWGMPKLRSVMRKLGVKSRRFPVAPCAWISREDIRLLKKYKPYTVASDVEKIERFKAQPWKIESRGEENG